MGSKIFLLTWLKKRKWGIIISLTFLIAFLLTIILNGIPMLKLTQTDKIEASKIEQYNPLVSYDDTGKHIFWVERDSEYNYYIKHLFNEEVYNIDLLINEYIFDLNVIENKNQTLLFWEGNNGSFYTRIIGHNSELPYKIANGTLYDYNFRRGVVVDKNQYLHMVGNSGHYDVHYINFSLTKNEWGDSMSLTQNLTDDYSKHRNPTITINEEDSILIAWESYSESTDDLPNNIIISYWNESNKPVSQVISEDYMSYTTEPTILIDDEDNFEIFWYESYPLGSWVSTRKFNQKSNQLSERKTLFNVTYFYDEESDFYYISNKNKFNTMTLIWRRHTEMSSSLWFAQIKNQKLVINFPILGVDALTSDLFIYHNDVGKIEFFYSLSVTYSDLTRGSNIYCSNVEYIFFIPVREILALPIIIGLYSIIFLISLIYLVSNYGVEKRDYDRFSEPEGEIDFIYYEVGEQSARKMWSLIQESNLEYIQQIDESEYFDRKMKLSTKKAEKIEKLLVAMANTCGGILVFGIDDYKNLTPLTSKQRDDINIYIGNVADKIDPSIIPKFKEILIPSEKDGGIICVFIPKYKDIPHRTHLGIYYFRSGSSSRKIPARNIKLELDE